MTDILRHTGKRRAIRIRRDFDRARRLLRTVATDPDAARAKVINKWRSTPRHASSPRSRRFGRPRLPALSIPSGPVARPDLPVAVILDAFSELAYRYEWNQILITPDDWRQRLAAQPPALLFVESAWNGNRGAWRLAMSTHRGPSPSLQELVAWCRAHAIPTVFWNKEDPPNYDRFIETARLFDQVFTVDANRIAELPARPRPRPDSACFPSLPSPGSTIPCFADAGGVHTMSPSLEPISRTSILIGCEQMDYLLPASGRQEPAHLLADGERTPIPAISSQMHLRRFVVGSLEYEQHACGLHLVQGVPERQLRHPLADHVRATAVRALCRADGRGDRTGRLG